MDDKQQEPPREKQPQSTIGIPLAIVVAGVLIAGAVYLSNGGNTGNRGLARIGSSSPEAPAPAGSFRDVSDSDFIRGNPDAPITIVEYSDFQCPYCKSFHPTMRRLVEENNDVRWVYRHFPLTSIHENAESGAIAAECAGRIAGNDVFWNFADALFDNQNRLGDALYIELANTLGVEKDAFESCRTSPEILQKIQNDSQEASSTGGRGTPHSLVITRDGNRLTIGGAVPYESALSTVQQARGK